MYQILSISYQIPKPFYYHIIVTYSYWSDSEKLKFCFTG